MNIPRYTAAASHYRTRGRYRSGGPVSNGARGVSPALIGRWQIPLDAL